MCSRIIDIGFNSWLGLSAIISAHAAFETISFNFIANPSVTPIGFPETLEEADAATTGGTASAASSFWHAATPVASAETIATAGVAPLTTSSCGQAVTSDATVQTGAAVAQGANSTALSFSQARTTIASAP